MQVKQRQFDPKADLYSLSFVLAEVGRGRWVLPVAMPAQMGSGGEGGQQRRQQQRQERQLRHHPLTPPRRRCGWWPRAPA